MSRCLSRSVDVRCNAKGVPVSILAGRAYLPVCEVVDEWREWFGSVFGEPERDVWIVDTPKGIYELHHVGFPVNAELENAELEQEQSHWVMERVED